MVVEFHCSQDTFHRSEKKTVHYSQIFTAVKKNWLQLKIFHKS